MRIYVSYFYQIRFFKGKVVPLSTAKWDPQWFHNNKGHSYVYRDKYGTYCGLRMEEFMPGSECDDLCRGACDPRTPDTCEFLSKYREQLDKLDFTQVMEKINEACSAIKNVESLDDVDVALIVHEAPDNPCSERTPIIEWFKSHGVIVREWERKNV